MVDLKKRLRGVFTAIVSPMSEDGLDFDAFRRLLSRQVEAGVAGVVPVGTTGEAATLTTEEAEALIRISVEEAGSKCFILAGTGSNDTKTAVKKARRAQKLGAHGLLVVTPYYNKPSQAGLVTHFSEIAASVDLPIMLYSVPGRTGVEIAPATAALLASRHANIVGIKEAGGRAERVTILRRQLGDDFIIHCGDDALTLPFLALGADGVTSVASNLIPDKIVAMFKAWESGKPGEALVIHDRISRTVEALFVETNPVPVKAAMAMRGLISEDVRAPLAPLTADSRSILTESLAEGAWQ
jgi:4-hydroxy-tetrahydrodipicolinate synthase